eukprot:gene32231-16794_t
MANPVLQPPKPRHRHMSPADATQPATPKATPPAHEPAACNHSSATPQATPPAHEPAACNPSPAAPQATPPEHEPTACNPSPATSEATPPAHEPAACNPSPATPQATPPVHKPATCNPCPETSQATPPVHKPATQLQSCVYPARLSTQRRVLPACTATRSGGLVHRSSLGFSRNGTCQPGTTAWHGSLAPQIAEEGPHANNFQPGISSQRVQFRGARGVHVVPHASDPDSASSSLDSDEQRPNIGSITTRAIIITQTAFYAAKLYLTQLYSWASRAPILGGVVRWLTKYRDVVLRCTVTIGMLALIRSGLFIPLPGVDMQHIPPMGPTSEGERLVRALYGKSSALPAWLFDPAVLRAIELEPHALFTGDFLFSTTLSLMAGSCIMHFASDFITYAGVGNGSTLAAASCTMPQNSSPMPAWAMAPPWSSVVVLVQFEYAETLHHVLTRLAAGAVASTPLTFTVTQFEHCGTEAQTQGPRRLSTVALKHKRRAPDEYAEPLDHLLTGLAAGAVASTHLTFTVTQFEHCGTEAQTQGPRRLSTVALKHKRRAPDEYAETLHHVLTGLTAGAVASSSLVGVLLVYLMLVLFALYLNTSKLKLPIIQYAVQAEEPGTDVNTRQDMFQAIRPIAEKKLAQRSQRDDYFPIPINAAGMMWA